MHHSSFLLAGSSQGIALFFGKIIADVLPLFFARYFVSGLLGLCDLFQRGNIPFPLEAKHLEVGDMESYSQIKSPELIEHLSSHS